jgi:SAM-dependent methyltransferase
VPSDTVGEQTPTIGELMLGVEGLAMLRLLYADAADQRAARVAEVRDVVRRVDGDPALAAPVGSEYGIADGYARWAGTYDRPLRLFAIEAPPLRRLLDGLPPGAVLDAACGSGRHSAYLAERGHTVTGVDQSPEMLALAREKVPGGRFLPGDLLSLPLDDGSVDAAVCALALVHVADVGSAIAELARVVRPGGRIVITDVHPVLVMLGWQAQFPTADGRGFMRLHPHLVSDYLGAALDAGLVVAAFEECLLTEDGAATPTAELIPDANRAAYVGLPAILVAAFDRPAN